MSVRQFHALKLLGEALLGEILYFEQWQGKNLHAYPGCCGQLPSVLSEPLRHWVAQQLPLKLP